MTRIIVSLHVLTRPETYLSGYILINSQQVIDPKCERLRCALQNARRSDSAGYLRAIVPRRRADGPGSDGSGRGLATGRLKASRRSEAGRAGARPPRRSPDAL